MVKLMKIKRRDFFQGDNIPILVSRTVKTRKFKFAVFSKWNMQRPEMETYTKIYSLFVFNQV